LDGRVDMEPWIMTKMPVCTSIKSELLTAVNVCSGHEALICEGLVLARLCNCSTRPNSSSGRIVLNSVRNSFVNNSTWQHVTLLFLPLLRVCSKVQDLLYPGHFHSVTKENHLTLQDSGCAGQDSNHERLEYKSEASPLETNKYIYMKFCE
jgi:hypothetical protein